MITNYSDLQLAIQSWLNRPNEVDQIPTFIQLAESRLQKELRIAPMETTFSLTISNGVIPVPADYLELKRAVVNTSPATKLRRKSVGWIDYFYARNSCTNVPKFIARDAFNFIFAPFPDSNYTVIGTYYAPITPLSNGQPTNWYTDNAPELLLFGALVEATPYIKQDERSALWQQRFNEAKALVTLMYKREQTRGSMMSGDYEQS